jgi:hypothetical protein
MSISRRLFFGSVLGVGAASTVAVDAERQPEAIRPDRWLNYDYGTSIGPSPKTPLESAQRVLAELRSIQPERASCSVQYANGPRESSMRILITTDWPGARYVDIEDVDA